MEELTQSLTQAADLCRKYGLSAQELERGAGLAEEYRVRVAVLGAFNTGKSALINGLLNTRLVRVSAEEETRLPVEICYGSQGVTLLRDGRAFRSDPTVLRAADSALEGAQMARVCLPLPALAELPGIGPYTAGAIASICFGERVAAVDGNVERVVSRLWGVREDVTRPPVRRAIAAHEENQLTI